MSEKANILFKSERSKFVSHLLLLLLCNLRLFLYLLNYLVLQSILSPWLIAKKSIHTDAAFPALTVVLYLGVQLHQNSQRSIDEEGAFYSAPLGAALLTSYTQMVQ